MKSVRIGGAGLLLLAGPVTAWAHSPVPGLGRFYNGMLHPVLAPAALIALVALGLLLGQNGLARSRQAVLAFLVALAAGGFAGSEWPGLDVEPGLLALGILAAASALAAWPPPATALRVLAGGTGALAGLALSDMAIGSGRWVVLAGTWLGAAFLALGVAAVAELAHRAWQKIGLRVLASWLAASALMALGLQWIGPLQKAGPPASGVAPAAGIGDGPLAAPSLKRTTDTSSAN